MTLNDFIPCAIGYILVLGLLLADRDDGGKSERGRMTQDQVQIHVGYDGK